jgi:MFS family permease
VTVRALWRQSGFRSLLVGQGVSAFGDWMATVAFMALVLEITGSTTAVGGVLALRLLPAAIGGVLAARLARVWDRRRIMLTTDAARAGMVAVVPLVHELWWVYLWAFLIEAAGIVFLPARDASIPDLVDGGVDGDLPLANGLVFGSSYGTIPLGAGAFALVAALPGSEIAGRPYATVFWVDAATYLVSFACIAKLRVLGPGGDDPHVAGGPMRLREAFRIPLVRAVMPAAAGTAVGLGALFSLGIVFVRDVLGATDAQFGTLIALFGVGAAGGLGMLRAARDVDALTATRSGVVAIGAVVAAFSLAPALPPAFLGAAAFGAATSFALASGMGALQSSLDGPELVVAFAAFHVVIRAGLAAAAIGAGIAGDLLDGVEWPAVGHLEPSRLVLLCSGLLVLASAARVRVTGGEAPPALRGAP